MRRAQKARLGLLLAVVLLLSSAAPSFAAESGTLDAAVARTASYVQKTVVSPQVGSIGGEWAVIALKRSGEDVPASWYDSYYAAVLSTVAEEKGVLSTTKYTEYSRVILALAAIGRYGGDVDGYDLLTPLSDYDKTIKQGLTGPAYALIALDSLGYAMSENKASKTKATREMYVSYLLSRQLSDGGWSLGGKSADPDTTAMVLQALANYKTETAAAAAIDKAVTRLSALQNAAGGYESWGAENSESTAQVLLALCALGVNADDSRFVKSDHTLTDALLAYTAGGGFSHTPGGGVNEMATEQALCALAAVKRQRDGQTAFFNMTDALPSVTVPAVASPGKTFSDIGGNENQTAIEALAARNILGGMGDGRFNPDRTMTRAEFAAIATHSLGLAPAATNAFSDVAAGAWYAGYVGTAYRTGIIAGVGGQKFDPAGTVTCRQACLMAGKVAKLCGLDAPVMDAAASSNAPILRGQAAQLLYDTLHNAKLL